MDWFETLEKKRRFALFAVILLMVATIALTSLRDPRSMDGFWHLKMGQDWIENGLGPWRDHHSFTFAGAPINSPPFAFQAGLHYLSKPFGAETGFKLYKFCSLVLVLVMMLWWLYRIKAPVLVYGLTLPVLVTVLQLRATARPELISYTFEILSLILYERARMGVSWKGMLPIALLMLVWSNYHSSIFGYIIFFGLFIDLGLAQLKQKAAASVWARWLLWGLLIVGVGFLNPSFTHPVIASLVFPQEWKPLIQEYQHSLAYKTVPGIYVFIVTAIITLVLAWKQRLYGYLLVCGFLLLNAWGIARLVTPTGIVVISVFAYTLSKLDFQALLAKSSRLVKVAVPILALLIFIVPLLLNVLVARFHISENRETRGIYPYSMVEYMNETGRQGRIFNEYEQGGFLMYQLGSESKVYIDGRTNILYPIDHFLKHRDAMGSASVLAEEIEKYDIQYAVLRNATDKALIVDQTGLMKLDYADVRYFLYSRENANFPLTGRLWARPYCWTDSDTKTLVDEQLTASIYLAPDSQLHQFLQIMLDYGHSQDADAFLLELNNSVFWPEASKRFAGYRAIENEEYALAASYFNSVAKEEPKDFLAKALTQIRLNKAERAEKILAEAMETQWPNLEFIDLVIMHALMTEIQEQQALTLLDSSYISDLAEQVKGFQLEGVGPKVFASTFCPNFD